MLRTTLPSLFTYADARSRGWSRRRLAKAVVEGQVVRLSEGWYAVPQDVAGLEPWQVLRAEHLIRTRFELARHPGSVASHTTAALIHGLAVSISEETPVDLTTVDDAPRSRRAPGLVIHHSDSLDHDTCELDGYRVTALHRTVADFLRSRTLPHGVALVDEAVRRGLLEVTDIRRVLSRQKRWRGKPKAEGALAIIDPLRETWAESYSFAALHLRGVALPLPQVNVFDESRNFVGRVDGLWPEAGVVAECDGESKYFIRDLNDAATNPEETALRKLQEEARRQARMVRLGLRFVRWTPAQIRDDPESIAAKARRTLAEADPTQFTGWIEWNGRLTRLPVEVPRPQVDLDSLRTSRSQARQRIA